MRTRPFGRVAVATGLSVSLLFSATCFGLATGTGLILVVNPSVMAGQPINGYAAMGEVPMSVGSTSPWGTPTPAMAPSDPVSFSYPTTEPMKGTIVTITANDAGGASVSAPVLVL